jgi:hypothetical protein
MVPSFLMYASTLVIGGFLFAVTGHDPSFDLTGVAALITAMVGVGAFVASFFRGRKNNARVEEVEEAASYVKGFDALIKRLQEEIETLHGEMTTERDKWSQEKYELLHTVRNLRTELQESVATNTTTKSQLMELKGQIRGFLTSQQYEEFTKHL